MDGSITSACAIERQDIDKRPDESRDLIGVTGQPAEPNSGKSSRKHGMMLQYPEPEEHPAAAPSGPERKRSDIIHEFVQHHGIVIVPTDSTNQRKPLLPEHNASARIEALQSWFDSPDGKNRGVSMPCGARNGLVAFDCDVKHGQDGVAQFTALCASLFCEPSPVWQKTPSGGRHYFYKYPGDAVRNRQGIFVDGKRKDIEIKSDKTSVGLDPDGVHYIMNGCLKDAPEMPQALISFLAPKPAQVSPGWLQGAVALLMRAQPGERNNQLNHVTFFAARLLAADPDDPRYQDIESAMFAAAADLGLLAEQNGADHVRSTIASGLQGGKAKGPFASEDEVPAFLRTDGGSREQAGQAQVIKPANAVSDWLKGAVAQLMKPGGNRKQLLNNITFFAARLVAGDEGDERRLELERTMADAAVAVGLDQELGGMDNIRAILVSSIQAGKDKGPYDFKSEIPSFLPSDGGSLEQAGQDPAAVQYPFYPTVLYPGSPGAVWNDGPLMLLPPPIFVFPREIRKMITEVAEAKSAPKEMLLGLVLMLGSACIGRARGIRYRDDWTEVGNLYLLLSADTGSGKTPAFKYIFNHLLDLEAKLKASYRKTRRKYQEEMLAYKKNKDPGMAAPKEPRDVQYLLEDSTIEAAAEALEDNPRGLLWVQDEFSGFFSDLDRYSNGPGGAGKKRLLKTWDSGVWNITRKSKDGMDQDKYIAKATIGLLGTIQPGLMNQVFTANDMKQGWPQRFLFLHATQTEPRVLPTPKISQASDELLRQITERLLSLEMPLDEYGVRHTEFLDMDDEAQQEFEWFVNLITQEAWGTGLHGFTNKLTSMVLRLALILHLMEWAADLSKAYPDVKVGKKNMSCAIDLTDWFIGQTRHAREEFLPGPGRKKIRVEKITALSADPRTKVLRNFSLSLALSHPGIEWMRPGELLAKGLNWPASGKDPKKSLGMHLSSLALHGLIDRKDQPTGPDGKTKAAFYNLSPLRQKPA